jgi:hypothetical protein
MRSIDHNLNNPMLVDTLCGSEKFSNVSCILLSYEEYQLIKIKDPDCIYIIEDHPDQLMYLGDRLIERETPKRMYLLGISKFGEYDIYVNETDGKHDKLIKVCRYDDPQLAITDLNRVNNVGSHHKINFQIYSVIADYISKDISLNDMIIGIISLFGYRDDTRLQSLIQSMISYDANISQTYLPYPLRKDIKMFKNNKNHLFKFYSDLYDLVLSYNYFLSKEFQKDPEELDLSKVIEKVVKIMTIKI